MSNHCCIPEINIILSTIIKFKNGLKDDHFKRRWSASTENFNRPSKTWKLLHSPNYVLKKD